jgi:putative heme transporter
MPREPHLVEDRINDEEMPRLRVTRRMLVLGIVFVVVALAFLYFVLPQVAGLDDTWERIEQGNPWWLALALVFTVLSFGGYVLLFQFVYVAAGSPIDLRASYQITMAGLAATRVFAAGGAGGIALTAWALRRSGMGARQVADSSVVFLSLTYVVYMAALIVVGLGLYLEVLPGPSPIGVTLVPAIFGAVVLAVFLLLALVPTDLERRMQAWSTRHHQPRLARIGRRLANVPAAVSTGVRTAIRHVRELDPSLLGSIAYWGFNIAVLWACFHAFGEAPPWTVIIMGYFVGMIANLLPLPGGVGGVDGGMIGAFAAFGVDFGLATVAVLTYRGFAFWLPTIPGAIAYFQLRKTVARWRRRPPSLGPAQENGAVAAGCYYTK